MKKLTITVSCLIILTLVTVDTLWAQKKGDIELRAVAEMEIEDFNSEGKKEIKRVPAAKVIPGGEVIYTIYYTNRGQNPTDKVVITNPLPEHMLYKDNSASGDGTAIVFSVDNGKSFDTPENLKIQDDRGREFPATASDYTHIRWVLLSSLPLNAKGQVGFRAILE